MESLISCCGINCGTCDARIATINNDDAMRRSISEKWSTFYKTKELLPEMINCTGCRVDGVKFGHCIDCEIRKCVNTIGYCTCVECQMMLTCKLVSGIHESIPDAIVNLRNLIQ